MTPSCTVRPPTAADSDKMAELASQLGYPCSGTQVRARLVEMQDPNRYAVYVAELAGGQVAGWISVYIFRSVAMDRCAEINGLIVDQEIRSRGIGKALIDAAEKWARGLGCDAISVKCNIKRDRAHRFYERHGFQHVKTQKSFRKSL
jgi:GNAT superfamily N-acetyltransferase